MKKLAILSFIFLLAFTIRLNYIVRSGNAIESDEVKYDSLARGLVQSRGYVSSSGAPTSHRPPAYPFILSLLYRIFGRNFFIIRLCQAIASALTACILYLIAEKIFDRGVAMLAGIFSSFYMIFTFYSRFLYTETFFSFLLAIIVFMIVKTERPEIIKFSLIGLLCGVLTLLRTTGAFLPFIAASGLWYRMRGEKEIIRRISPSIFALFVSFIVVLTPWTVRNYKVHGRFVFVSTNGGLNMYQAIRPYKGKLFEFGPRDEVSREADKIQNEAERSSFYVRQALLAYKEDPLRALRLFVMRFLFFWNVIDWNVTDGNTINYHFIFIMPFALFGVLLGIKEKKDVFMLLLVILYFTSLVCVFQGFARFRMPIDGYIIIFGSYGLYEFIKERKSGIFHSLAAGVYLFLAYLAYRDSLQTKHFIRALMEKLGLW